MPDLGAGPTGRASQPPGDDAFDRLGNALRRSAWLRANAAAPATFDFDLGREHVCVLRGPERAVCLKLPRPDRPATREVHASEQARSQLDVLPGGAPPVRVPRVLHVDEAVVATEFVVEEPGPRPDVDALVRRAVALGDALARLHAAPFPHACGDLWIRRAASERPWLERSSNEPQRALLRQVFGDPGARGALRAVAERWRPDAFVHGDLRRSNVLGLASGSALWLIDWELAGLGDRRWDLGCVFAELAVLLHGGGVPPGVSPVDCLEALLGALVDGYEGRTGGALTEPRLVLPFASAWLLQQSWELRAEVAAPGGRDLRLELGLLLARG